MTLIVDEVMLREPNLLVPGKKPVGPVKIDWNHILSKDLAAYWLFQSGHPRDMVGNNHGTYYADVKPNSHQGGSRYCPVSTDEGSALEITDNTVFRPDSNGMTAIVDFEIFTMNTATIGLLNRYQGVPSAVRSWLFGLTAGGNLIGAFSTNGTYQGANNVNGSATVSINNRYVAAMTWKPSTATLYLNGVQDGINTSSASSLHTGSTPLYIGGPQYSPRGIGSAQNSLLFGHVYSASFYRRVLSTAEIYSLYHDRYQFLIPA